MTNKTQRNEDILRRQVFPIPQNVAPTGTRCIQINIPDDDEHEAIFFGAVDLLCKWNSWQRDTINSGALASQVWKRAIYDNPTFDLCSNGSTVITESDYEMSLCEQLRVHDGKLQALCCGEWTTIPGAEGITLGGQGQTGTGADQPAPNGGCATYHATFQASEQYLIPYAVNTGDTINIANLTGAGNDGSEINWRCPDGNIFFAGFCGGGATTSGSDPAPSLNHMAVVVKIGSAYYAASSGIITVPGSVSNQNALIMVNDSALSGNSGSYALDVTVCNNSVQAKTATFDFRVNRWSSVFPSITWGVWTPGSGFVGTPVSPPDSNSLHVAQINAPVSTWSSITVTQLETIVTGGGSGGANGGQLLRVYRPSLTLFDASKAVPNATLATTQFVDNKTAVTGMDVSINSGTTNTNVTLAQLKVTYTGSTPSGWPSS